MIYQLSSKYSEAANNGLSLKQSLIMLLLLL